MSFLSNIETFITRANQAREVLSIIRNLINDVRGRPSDVLPVSNIQATTSIQGITKISDRKPEAEATAVNPGVRLQFNPDTETKLPVLYGRAVFGGNVVDAALVNNNRELQVCLALAMITGNNIAGEPSTYELFNVYLDNQRLNFQADGQVIASATDTEGNTSTAYNNKIGVYVYASSTNHLMIQGREDTGVRVDARNVFSTWTTNHLMSGVLFAIIRLAWDPDLNLDRFPQFSFDIANSMSLPGDVLYDYMTNEIYGCSISEENIKVTSI
jgi:hypothetical protein